VEVDPMSSLASDAPADKPKGRRTASVWNAGGGRWVLQLTFWHPRRSAEDQFYHLSAIPSDYGTAYELRKLQADGGEVYHVNLDSAGPSCDCPGHLRHGHCKHRDALEKLHALGKLDQVRAAVAKPAPAPATKPAPVKPVPVMAGGAFVPSCGDDL
jgi:hypothetical protein